MVAHAFLHILEAHLLVRNYVERHRLFARAGAPRIILLHFRTVAAEEAPDARIATTARGRAMVLKSVGEGEILVLAAEIAALACELYQVF